MAIKIGQNTSKIVKVKTGGETKTAKYVFVKKNGVTKQIYGGRNFTLTLTNPSYMVVTYSYVDYTGTTKSGSVGATTTFTDVGYDQDITISASPAPATAQYTYSVSTTGGTYTPSTSSLSITGSRTLNKYPVTISAGTGISSAYLSTSSTATSGSASGTNYDYGTTVYGFVVIADGYYTIDSTWTLISGTAYTAGAIYRVGSLTVGTSNDFGTKSATRNPYIKITFTNGTATLDGSSITSGTNYYVQYNSTHTVIVDSNANYYISSSTSTGRTQPTAYKMTLNGNSTVYKRNNYNNMVITSNTTKTVTSSRYYTYKINIPTEFGYACNGNITFGATSYQKTINPFAVDSNTANYAPVEEYYTGTITPYIYFYSVLVYDTTSSAFTQDTAHGFVDDNNSVRPYKFDTNKKLIIAHSNSTSSVELGSPVIISTDGRYNRVDFQTAKTNTDFTGSVSYANVASAYVTATSWIGAIDVESVSVGETYTISSDNLVVTRLGWQSTQTASLTPVSSTQNVSPTTFTFNAFDSRILTTTNLTISETITRVTFPNTTGFEIYNNGTSSYGNYTTYDGTLVNNIPTRMYSSLSSYLSYNEVWINNAWYTLNNLPSNWSYSKTTYTYSGRTYYGYSVTYDTSYEDEGETYGDRCSVFVGTNRSSAGMPGYLLTHYDITGMDYPDHHRFTNFRIRVRTS